MNNFPGSFDTENPPRLYVCPARLWAVPVAPLGGDHDFPTVTISDAEKELIGDWRFKISAILGSSIGIAFRLTNRKFAAVLKALFF